MMAYALRTGLERLSVKAPRHGNTGTLFNLQERCCVLFCQRLRTVEAEAAEAAFIVLWLCPCSLKVLIYTCCIRRDIATECLVGNE